MRPSQRGRRRSPAPSADLNQARAGWVVVACAFTLMFVGFAAAYCFAAFFTAFQEEFGASRGDVALVFSVAPAKVLAFAKGAFSQTRHQF